MPNSRKAVAFSAKQKKEQLKARRERKKNKEFTGDGKNYKYSEFANCTDSNN